MARVLIIEDEPNIAMVLQEVLLGEGHDVQTALTGTAGLKLLKEPPAPDIILLDLFMPEVSGHQILEKIRADQELHNTPVIIVSGSIPNTQDFPARATYQAFIPKPFDLIDVIRIVRQYSPEPKPRGSQTS